MNEVRRIGDLTVLEPRHALYEGNDSDALETALLRAARRGGPVLVDLSRVRPLTAHVMGILAHAQSVAERAGGGIHLCGATRVQRRLLAVTGLSRVIPLHDDLVSAVRAMTRPVARAAAH